MGVEVGAGVADAVGPGSVFADTLNEFLAVGIALVNNGAAFEVVVIKQQCFGFEVIVKVFVVVQMILGEVSKDGNLERDALCSVLCQGMGANFHDGILALGRLRAGQLLL